ncbi:MAG: hypothetical protein M3071_02415 [Actinomycetota bacterium]|nr:hypothetical protein [Actinomycetota bacterium]
MANDRRDPPYALRILGAFALLAVGALHIDQYFAVHYNVIPVIGPLFLLNLIGAVVIALLLILPTERLRAGGFIGPLALAGIGLAITSAIFLLISEQTTLFGFMENGYRTEIVLSFIAEAATVGLLGTYLVTLVRRHREPAAR